MMKRLCGSTEKATDQGGLFKIVVAASKSKCGNGSIYSIRSGIGVDDGILERQAFVIPLKLTCFSNRCTYIVSFTIIKEMIDYLHVQDFNGDVLNWTLFTCLTSVEGLKGSQSQSFTLPQNG